MQPEKEKQERRNIGTDIFELEHGSPEYAAHFMEKGLAESQDDLDKLIGKV